MQCIAIKILPKGYRKCVLEPNHFGEHKFTSRTKSSKFLENEKGWKVAMDCLQ